MRKAFDLGSGKKMNSFSKGMQQAAFILTMCKAEVSDSDEPIDGLDPIKAESRSGNILSTTFPRDDGADLISQSS